MHVLIRRRYRRVTVSLRIRDQRHYSHCSSMDTPQDSAPPTVTKLTKAPQCHIMSVTRGTIYTVVHKTHERSSVTCSLVHRIAHNTDDGNGKCGQQFICSRRLSCSNFRQTPIVQYIYDKSLSSTKLQTNRPRNVENKDINSLRSSVMYECRVP